MLDAAEVTASSRPTPKQVEFRPDLPRSTVGKVLKTDVRGSLLGS